MLPPEQFLRYRPDGPDMWRMPPDLHLADLKKVTKAEASRKPLLTFIMAFSNYRVSQLPRSLECIARQSWRKFEVIIVDNGSTDGTAETVAQFEPYIPGLRLGRIEREGFTADPSIPFKSVFGEARGEVIAIMQPEILMVPEAAKALHAYHFEEPPPGSLNYVISRPELDPLAQKRRWVALRVGFFDAACQQVLDTVDWHSSLRAVEGLFPFGAHREGLSNRSNAEWLGEQMAQWFVGSALADDPVWTDMPSVRGHGSIDFYLLNYRHLFGYRDITPPGFWGYHQYHLRTAVAPIEDRGEFEQWTVSTDGILARLDSEGRWPEGYPRRDYQPPSTARFNITAGAQTTRKIEYDNLGNRIRRAVRTNDSLSAEERRPNIDPTPKVIPGWKPPSDEQPAESVRVRRAKGKT